MSDVLRPYAGGDAVAELQQLLLERGLLPPEARGETAMRQYGPITVAAVRTFQAKAHLDQDEIVGPKTWAALRGAETQEGAIPDADYLDTGSALTALALHLADEEWRLGVVEKPSGSNRGARIDEYLLGHRRDGAAYVHYRRDPSIPDGYAGAPWCGRFALWCVEEAATRLKVYAPTKYGGDFASAQKWRDWALANHRLVVGARAGRVGLIIPPTLAGKAPHGHVVLVATVAGGRVSTREGNSGNRIAARWRSLAEFIGFVDLN